MIAPQTKRISSNDTSGANHRANAGRLGFWVIKHDARRPSVCLGRRHHLLRGGTDLLLREGHRLVPSCGLPAPSHLFLISADSSVASRSGRQAGFLGLHLVGTPLRRAKIQASTIDRLSASIAFWRLTWRAGLVIVAETGRRSISS